MTELESGLEVKEKAVVQTFTRGKSEERNEDFFGSTEDSFVIADGATDKSGKKYDGKTGGELASRLVVQESLMSTLTGAELVNHLNAKIGDLYSKLNITESTKDPKYRFSCGFICVRAAGDKILITYLGDAGFRINGKDVYREVKQVDIDNAEERARFIEQTGDVPASRNHIMPRLIKQLFTDGYFAIPEEPTMEAWEKLHAQVEQEDPDKWKKYKSTKQKDDRTVAIISFDK